MSEERESAGVWDVVTKSEVLIPPQSSSSAFNYWAQSAPAHDVQRWGRTAQTVKVMEAIIQNGMRLGYTRWE